jgi:hypothetical protein
MHSFRRWRRKERGRGRKGLWDRFTTVDGWGFVGGPRLRGCGMEMGACAWFLFFFFMGGGVWWGRG